MFVTDVGLAVTAILATLTWRMVWQRRTRATRGPVMKRDDLADGRCVVQQGQAREGTDRLATGVAHDCNNFLMSISANLELIEHDLEIAAQQRQRLARIRQAVDRGADLTRRLLATSGSQILQPEAVDVSALIRQMVASARVSGDQLALGQTIRLRTDLAAGSSAACVDPAQMRIILLNLAANARDALPAGGTVTIRTENGSDDHVVLTVTDDGVGMAPEVVARALEPCLTTKTHCSGAGLGLSTVDGIVRQSGGDMHIQSTPGVGTTVQITLPRAPRASNRKGPAADSAIRPAARLASVLVIDDDKDVLNAVVATLRSAGVQCVAASDGPGGLARMEEILAEPNGSINLVLVDYAMPGMNGAALASAVRRRWPGLPVIFMTGYAPADALAGERFILQKPFRTSDLLRMFDDAAALS